MIFHLQQPKIKYSIEYFHTFSDSTEVLCSKSITEIKCKILSNEYAHVGNNNA